MGRLIIIMCLCFCLSLLMAGVGGISAWAQDDEFFVELASDHIDVTTGFTGAYIKVFGYRKDKDADVVVVIRGPEKMIIVWRKAKIMGAWINRYSAVFKNMPLFYDYAHRKHEEGDERDENSDVLMANGVSVESLFSAWESGEKHDFKEALIREKQQYALYPKTERSIEFLNDNFFRVDFHISAAAPTGEYVIESILIKNGKIKDRDIETLKVEQVGLNAFFYRAAHDHAVLYGLACIFLALGAGWFVSVIQLRA